VVTDVLGQLIMGPIGCPETSVIYQSALCNMPEERRHREEEVSKK